jgi:hypothetical protein
VRIVEDRSDLPRLDPARLDRLVILRARELAERPPKRWRSPEPAPDPSDPLRAPDPLGLPIVVETMRTANSLPRQSMEAWLLRHVDQLGDIAISRAMDCSRTALTRHLERAEQAMREQLGDRYEEAIETLREAIDRLDPAPAVRAAQQRRRRRWIGRLLLGGAALIPIVRWAAFPLGRAAVHNHGEHRAAEIRSSKFEERGVRSPVELITQAGCGGCHWG